MARPRNPNPPVRQVVYIRPDLYAWAGLELFSELHGRIPHGKWSELFNALLEKAYLETRKGATDGKTEERSGPDGGLCAT